MTLTGSQLKDMLEQGRPATADVVKHVDRCLSCLSCMTTCPSGVNYMHLVDQARVYIERTYRRPLSDRALRWVLAAAYQIAEAFAWRGAADADLVLPASRALERIYVANAEHAKLAEARQCGQDLERKAVRKSCMSLR